MDIPFDCHYIDFDITNGIFVLQVHVMKEQSMHDMDKKEGGIQRIS